MDGEVVIAAQIQTGPEGDRILDVQWLALGLEPVLPSPPMGSLPSSFIASRMRWHMNQEAPGPPD